MKVVGLEKTLRALSEFPKRLQNKHMRIALNAGGGIVKRAIQSQTDSKHIRQSQIVKVKQSKSGWYAAIGTKRKKTIVVKRKGIINRTRRPSETLVQEKRFNISRIAHLLEKGMKSHTVKTDQKKTLASPVNGVWVAFGRRVSVRSRGKFFMQLAAATSGAAATAKTLSKLDQGVIAEAVRLFRE